MFYDSIFYTTKVTYFDANKEAHELSAKYYENSMVDELNDFANLFENPNDEVQAALYKKWFELARTVNMVMFNLRESADLTFPVDNNR